MRNLVCVALLAFTAILPLRDATAASANLSLTVTPTGGVVTPPQAVAAGFTTLAFDGDMTKSFDVSCANPATSNHQWYLGSDSSMYANCANLTYPHTDETDGSTVLDIHLGPSTQDGGILGRVGIATADMHAAHSNDFPINAYYECTVRYDSYSISHAPLWSNCWQSDSNQVKNAQPCCSMEYDFTEFHGGYQYSTLIGNNINWPCGLGGPCSHYGWAGDPANIVQGYSPTQYHKYGVLMKQTSNRILHMASYLDDILISEGDVELSSSPGGPPQDIYLKQRNSYVVDLTSGCGGGSNWDEGGFYCMNINIDGVNSGTDGKFHVQTAQPVVSPMNFPINIQGVVGVDVNRDYFMSMDNWGWWLPGLPCVVPGTNTPTSVCTITLLTTRQNNGGQPLPYPGGTYVSGGIINKWTDPGMHVYVKSVRVWSCAAWSNTQCSQFNPN